MNGAIFDIGSGSVGLANILIEKGKIPTLKFKTRYNLPIEKKPYPKNILHNTAEALRQSIGEMQKKTGDAPVRSFCFLGPHLVASQTRVIRVNFSESKKISATMVDELVEKEMNFFKNEHLKQSGLDQEIFLEKKVMKIRLNGYEVSNYKDKVATELEISVFLTLSGTNVTDLVKSVIGDSLHNNQIEFHSFSFAYFSVIRDILESNEDFLFIDIGSEITDICVTKEGQFVKSVSFPGGKNEIIRYMSKEKMMDEANVISSLRNYSSKVFEEKTKIQIEKEIDLAGTNWLNNIRSVLGGLSLEDKLPQKFFILADDDISAVFKRLMVSTHLSEIMILNKEPEINTLTGADLRKFCDNKSGTIDDPFLMIPTIFVNRLLN